MARTFGYRGQMGSAGSGNGQFSDPQAIAINANYIYVADRGNNRIQVFNKNTFAYYSQFGTNGSGNGQFFNPYGMAIDNTHIYVFDYGNLRIQVFNLNTFGYVKKFTITVGEQPIACDDYYLYASMTSNYYTAFEKAAIGEGSYIITKTRSLSPGGTARDIFVDNSYIYLATVDALYIYDKASFFSGTGALSPLFTVALDYVFGVWADSSYIYIARNKAAPTVDVLNISTQATDYSFGSVGAGNGQFNSPRQLKGYGKILCVNDYSNTRIQVFEIEESGTPAVPSNLSATCGVNRSIILNWTDNS